MTSVLNLGSLMYNTSSIIKFLSKIKFLPLTDPGGTQHASKLHTYNSGSMWRENEGPVSQFLYQGLCYYSHRLPVGSSNWWAKKKKKKKAGVLGPTSLPRGDYCDIFAQSS